MKLNNLNVYFFGILLFCVTIAAYFVLQPFLLALCIAAILAIIFQRPQRFFERLTGGKRHLAALCTSLLAISLFVAVFVTILGLVVNEAADFYQRVSGEESFMKNIDGILESSQIVSAGRYLGIEKNIDAQTISKIVSSTANALLLLVQKAYQGIAHFIFLSFVVFFTLYYLLVGGKDLIKRIMYLSPLKNNHERMLIDKFVSMITATVKGTLVVGIVQGSLGGILFAIVGIPSAVVWGIIMAILSLIPMVGSSVVWFPAGAILLLTGNIWQGITVLLFGGLVISLIDNFLRPKLVGKDTQMHPLLIFFATLGGISLFGLPGFIIGPIIMTIFLALWEIYAVEFKQQLKEYNQ